MPSRKAGFLIGACLALLLVAGVSSAGAAKTVPTCPGIPGCRHSLDQRAGWEGWVTNSPSHCSARVMKPFLNANNQVAAWTEVFCPKKATLTIRSRLEANFQFADLTVSQQGCLQGSCAKQVPRGFSYYPLACPKTGQMQHNNIYYSDIAFYGTGGAATGSSVRSRNVTLSPNCDE
ncbi:MAG: hypothetical protein ACRDK1_03025 [Solirubrobacterales bacterium]